MVSPVLGLRPVRAARWPVLKLPKPTSCKLSPSATACVTTATNASMVSPAALLLVPTADAIASTSSCLFIFIFSNFAQHTADTSAWRTRHLTGGVGLRQIRYPPRVLTVDGTRPRPT